MKPGNILITPTGQVKITDFGIAKAVDAAPVTQTGMVMGTAQYISPEQALGEDATAASDVYSLGVVGYEAIAGRRPFLGDGAITVAMKHIREEPPPLPTDLPANVRELIEITMAKDPHSALLRRWRIRQRGGRGPRRTAPARSPAQPTGPRPATAMMAPAVAPRPAPAPQPRPQPPARNDEQGWSNGQKALAAAAVILLIGALVLVGFLLMRSTGDSDTPAPRSSTTRSTTTTTTPPPTTTERNDHDHHSDDHHDDRGNNHDHHPGDHDDHHERWSDVPDAAEHPRFRAYRRARATMIRATTTSRANANSPDPQDGG